MPSILSSAPVARPRQVVFGLLLFAIPACGLSDYEALMVKSQKNEERFREEQKYLDGPVQIPSRPDDKGQEQALANMFFRPPRGIELKPRAEMHDNLAYQYRARTTGRDFSAVEIAFGNEEDKEFANQIVALYGTGASGQSTRGNRQILPVGQQTPISFDTWDFSGKDSIGYSINITQNRPKPIAIIYIYNSNKSRYELVRGVIELSLQSLALDAQVGAARQRFNQNAPWQLKPTPGR